MTVEISTLSNGLRVATDPMPHAQTVTVEVCVDTGSRYEPQEINGISHFLEHMAFKGTERRSAQDIAKEFDAIGGHFNAYTSREHTVYYAKVLKNDLPVAMDILGDILQHSVFDPEEVAREQGVILQEIAQTNDTPDDIVFDYFQEMAYPDQPIGRSILGTEALVSSFTRGQIVDYVAQHYHGSRMVLAAAGNVEHKALVQLAEQTFSSLKNEPKATLSPATYKGGELRKPKELEQVHLVLGFQGISYLDPDIYTMQLLSLILGGGMSSRLFQEIREKRGLVYSVYSFSSSYRDGGMFGVYAGTGEEHLNELVPVTCEELIKMTHNVTEEELNLAKTQIRTNLLMGLESTLSRAEDLGRHLLCFGRPIPMEEILQKVEAVSIQSIQKLMEKTLKASTPTLAAIGNLKTLEPYKTIAGRF